MSRPRRWQVAFAVCLALAGTAGVVTTAHADTAPSVWERARDPATAESYRLHVEVQQRLAQSQTAADFGFSSAFESQKDTVRVMLERRGAASSQDLRLRFDLGFVYVLLGKTEELTYYRLAASLLGEALEIGPDHPAAEEAWSRLAEACGHLGDHACERRAYMSVLRLTTEEADRGTSTLNLAETDLHVGRLTEAIRGYREALRIASRSPSRTLAPLALWGLAVALDRSGDTVSADKEALAVLELQASSGLGGLLRSSGVFFYPDYELRWYDGVGASARARKPGVTAADAAREWRFAEDAFAAYVAAAERGTNSGAGRSRPSTTPADRWLELAKVRYANAKRERERAEKRRGKLPVTLPGTDDETSL